jgi:hypothetical protein
MLRSTTIHVGAVPASEIGHNTGKTPGECAPADGFRPGNDHSLAAPGPAKLEP